MNEEQYNLALKVVCLVKALELTQFHHIPDFSSIVGLPILTREDLRTIKMDKGVYLSKTSGSTGEPVTVAKTQSDRIWTHATNIRDYRWRGWDPTRNVALIKPGIETRDLETWGLPSIIEPKQGKTFKTGYRPFRELQAWLEDKNPHYLICAPSIRDMLDLGRISNYIAWRGTGEVGGSTYSSEECGIISIQCPDNPLFHHVMENQLIEIEKDGSALITTLTNPYIKRYRHGDMVELGQCTCRRTLQTIKSIKGRVRNMFTMANGDKRWPLFGSRTYYEKYGIKRYKVIQPRIGRLIIKIISDDKVDEESLKKEICVSLGEDLDISIEYVNGFNDYKYEEFVSELP